MYVEDFVLCYKSKNMNFIERQLQLCLHKIEHLADENGFKFFKTKTACVHFYYQRTQHPDSCLKLGKYQINVV